MLALHNGVPQVLSLKSALRFFIDFRKDIVFKRTKFHLSKTREKAHILCGLAIALENIDEMIDVIKNSADTAEAKKKKIEKKWEVSKVKSLIEIINDPEHKVVNNTYFLSERQVRAILEIRLSKLTGLERSKISDDLEECSQFIEGYLKILSSPDELNKVLIKELEQIKEKLSEDRKTEISEIEETIDDESLISSEEWLLLLPIQVI